MPSLIPPSLSLYIHFPWCVKKCPYCDFNSHQIKNQLDEESYLKALIADLQNDLSSVWGRTIHSVFMGGGTPSLFSAKSMRVLIQNVRALLPLSPDCEVTMELNPGAKEYDDLEAYREAGINRLSIGVQSMNDDSLNILGRVHSSEQALSVVKKARTGGFENINLDLMFALPRQTLLAAKEELEKVIALDPDHISYYQLTMEPNTLFNKFPPQGLPQQELKDEMYNQGRVVLNDAGFNQYEVSAYAKEGKQCQHNINYWKFGDYLGIGAGAHSKISHGATGEIIRSFKHKHPEIYLKSESSFVQSNNVLAKKDLYFEYMLNAVRLMQPIKRFSFEKSTGLDFEDLKAKLGFAADYQWIALNEDELRLTESGFLLSDEILKKLL